jgi:hypothetical protein
MRAYLPARAGLLGAAALVAWTIGAAAQTAGPLPFEPLKDSGQSITGAFEGWYENRDGTITILVGYFNRNRTQTLDIPVGPNNRIEPGDPDKGQPTHFLPRRQWGVFTITVPKDFGKNKLTWTLVANGQTTVIPLHLDPLWIVEPFKDAGIGNTPPSVRFDPGGLAYQGPPDKPGPVLAATGNQALPLTVWVSDDGIRPPESRPRPGPPATVSWSKYRGPGPVTFEKAAPVVDDKDGKATTTALFTVPGEYVLRLQANDQTGNGGGGFQCCWTNVHVRVSVR